MLKADVSGSLEAFEDEIAKLPQSDVQVQVVRSGVGGITESDVNLAAASDAVVLGFNVRPVGEAAQLADREGVEIRTYSVIYRAFEELRDAMQGMLAPGGGRGDRRPGRDPRDLPRLAASARSPARYVTDGKVTRGAKVRLVRDGAVVYDGDDRVAAARSGGRPRGRRRLRVRHRAQQLLRRQGRRHARGLRDPAGRAHAFLGVADEPAFVVLMRVHLHFPDVGSLKGKRAELNRVKAHLRERCGATVAEVAHQDTWQRSTLAVAIAGGSPGRCDEAADNVVPVLDAPLSAGRPGRAARRVMERPGVTTMTADRMRRVDEAMREVLSDAITNESRIRGSDSSQ